MKKSLQLLAFVAALCAQIPAFEVLALPSIRVVRSVPSPRLGAQSNKRRHLPAQFGDQFS
jgi:hypothetical protein